MGWIVRLNFFVIVFTLLSFCSGAWQAYQYDLQNTGSAAGKGYFPAATLNLSRDDYGMDFQPLADDIDSDGRNEIVTFSNNSLIVMDAYLNVLNQIKVGTLLGQPSLFNFDNDSPIEIIFNAQQDSNQYFFVYEYNNSGFRQEMNISLPHDSGLGGIKCLKLNGSSMCIFKDLNGYINVIDLNQKADVIYNTTPYGEKFETIPAIGDVDGDGNQDAVFWYDENDGGGYGFYVFDIAARQTKWKVDNIFRPFMWNFFLKGQPVLVDLNNDGKLEIAASVFYDDFPSGEIASDWFTELYVYDYKGDMLFSKCESGNVGCNDRVSTLSKWEGTNPFVLDYNKDGKGDICFIKDRKSSGNFAYMAMNCYNYSGDEIANVQLGTGEDSIKGTAMAADMNNDGEKEIIISHDVYLQNGTSIFNMPSLSKFHPITADLDGNGGLDLLWTSGNKIREFLDDSNYSVDLSVSASDIKFSKHDKGHVNISVIIKNSGDAEADGVKVVMYNTETLENKTSVLDVRRKSNATFSAVLRMNGNENVMVSADYDNEINETNENNNFASKEFLGLPYVYVSSSTGLLGVDDEIKNYIKNKLTSGYYTESQSEADAEVYIGKNNPKNQVDNVNYLDKLGFGFEYGSIKYYDKVGANPYSAIVSGVKEKPFIGTGNVIIMVAGNEIDGNIAGVKEFIKNQDSILGTKDSVSFFIDDENLDGVKIWDYMHNDVNKGDYNQNSEQFRKIARNALNDSMFTEVNYNVTASGSINLRLRNLKPDFSNDYLLYLNSTSDAFMPVVMSGGIWADITAWQDLGGELSSSGRDVWLIEMTGGPNTECSDCINYNYTNLADDFWPALIGAVQKKTGKDKIQYVAHSNGCRTALDSLSNWSAAGKPNAGKVIYNGSELNVDMLPNPVDTFVGVACPGNFSELSYFARQINLSGGVAIERMRAKGNLHPKFGDVAHELESVSGEVAGITRFSNNPKISLNLFEQYFKWISGDTDSQPGSGLSFNSFTIIGGRFISDSDLIVPIKDEDGIFAKIQSNNKTKFIVNAIHVGMAEDNQVKKYVKESLNRN